MLRRRKPERSRPNGVIEKRESSRLSPLVISNPVNQSAHWSQDSYLLNDLVGMFPLPQVVRCSSRLVPGEDQHLPVNVHVPMLLCAGRSARKLLAKHVGTDSRSQKLTETDDSIVIPSDYDGNFVRLQARTTKDKSVARTLHDIASSHVPAFVNFSSIISFSNNNHQQKTNGVMVSSDSIYSEPTPSTASSLGTKLNSKHNHADGSMQHRKVHPPGGVFMVQGVTTGKTKTKRKTREVTLIKCSDDTGNEILIPSDQHGEVIEVETPPSGTARLSVQPKDLMANNRYPGLVRYVYGDHAPRLTPCSLMFTLIDTFEEDSVIGCLLYPNHALMIEIPMTSSLGFQVAQNRDDVMSMPLPRHALGVVQNRRETFMRDLKLKCKFLHRVNQGLMQNWSMSGRADDDMPSATVRTRQYANEAFFYL